MGGLEVQEDVDLHRLPVEAVLLVADIADRLAGRGLEFRGIDDFVAVLVLLHKARRQPDLAGNDDTIGGRKGFASDAHSPGIHASLRRFPVHQVNDFIGNSVADLVRVTFGNGFTREKIISAHAGFPSKNKPHSCYSVRNRKTSAQRHKYIFICVREVAADIKKGGPERPPPIAPKDE